MKIKMKKPSDFVARGVACIESCQTEEQLEVAEKYTQLLLKKAQEKWPLSVTGIIINVFSGCLKIREHLLEGGYDATHNV